ncbi:MAG: pyridoxal-phosphate dependent enzyme [Deltaproteobacteria bacterium]|nr:pyridoxal-phosphate dependent enzyme [Deltaproteobacteria bacterium]
MIEMICGGCGQRAPESSPFSCPNQGSDDIDHVLAHRDSADTHRIDDDPNPFVRFRSLFSYYDAGRRHGMSDAELVALARELDARIEAVDGTGFRETPVLSAPNLGAAPFEPFSVFVKDETHNVSGSHKARHLMGVALYLEVAERVGLRTRGSDLAISSCGNAALGAAVVARAADRSLRVFVPTWAEPRVVDRLIALGAVVEPCERTDAVVGDPCTLRMREAVRAGAIPFSCQGSDNGLAIEGGLSLGLELALQVARIPMEGSGVLDRLFVQVGGGALLSSTVQAFREARRLGLIETVPKIFAVQAIGAAPLARAYTRLIDHLGHEDPVSADAVLHGEPLASEVVDRTMSWAVAHRSQIMWPWDDPRSVAHGILDDETYDWAWIVRGLLESGGRPVTVSEEALVEANQLGRSATNIRACATGTSGLAGMITLARRHEIRPYENVAVLFTGIDRQEAP